MEGSGILVKKAGVQINVRSEKAFIIAGFCLISIIWGSTWLAIRVGLESVPPFYAAAIRFTLALTLLLLINALRGKRIPLDRSSVKVYLTLGFLSFSFPFAFIYWGEQYVPSGLTSILFAVYPFVVAFFSHFLLPSERLNRYKIFGMSLGFSGVLVIFSSDIHLGEGGILPMAAIVSSSALQGLSMVIVKKIGKHVDPVAMSCGGLAIGVTVMYGLALIFEDFSGVHLDVKGLGSILYLASFGTVVTFIVFYWLLKRVEAVYLSLTSLITPILAMILGWAWLRESLAPRIYSGAALVLLGIFVANAGEYVKKLGKA